jgi:hypothetical protein
MKNYISQIPYQVPCKSCGTMHSVIAKKNLVLLVLSCDKCPDKKPEKGKNESKPKPEGKSK